MKYRNLGNTGLTVSEVGLGCNRLGEEAYDDSYWIDLVREAVDLGVTVFDTSERYADSHSEDILGATLGGPKGLKSTSSGELVIATKVSGISAEDDRPYSVKHILAACDGSLRRLRVDCIDVYQLHSPDREALERLEWAEAFTKLREAGKIRFPAVAIRTADDGLFCVRHGMPRVLQVTYNMVDTAVADELLDAAHEAGVGILCRMPLARGILTGKFKGDPSATTGHRAGLFNDDYIRDVISKAEALMPIGEEYDGGITRMAHHFSLTPQSVSAIIPGARTSEQLHENVAASNGLGLDPGFADKVAAVRREWT
jgi:myo-inositol catabolism protein IolS